MEADDAETRSDPICSLATVQNLGKVSRSASSPQCVEAQDSQAHTLAYYCLLHLTPPSMGLCCTTSTPANQL